MTLRSKSLYPTLGGVSGIATGTGVPGASGGAAGAGVSAGAGAGAGDSAGAGAGAGDSAGAGAGAVLSYDKEGSKFLNLMKPIQVPVSTVEDIT
ncbi:MAG: hypothetical protein HFG47_13415, partial [Lachnospiraceae bacterium]|nr:hypothetical protein [Lachnospiraceae bacterium]